MGYKKVFVIGIDGLPYSILHQLIREYDLKNIRRIVENGASGPLRLVLPYSSAPNWVSLTTGVNPGKHGFYSFFFPRKNAYEHQFPNSTFVKIIRIWDILCAHGKKVLVINVPTTYPPQQIYGYMITCMLTPSINSNFSYPASLADEIRANFPSYAFDTNWNDYQEIGIDHLIDALLDSARQRKELLFYLLAKEPFDFIMAVFTETDRLFHAALNLLDRDHPHFDENAFKRNKDKIARIFRIIDSSLCLAIFQKQL